ncbi:MAG: glycoside hydrolase family 15 protein [Nanoarchaeota archaeon]
MIQDSVQILKTLRHKSGLFSASVSSAYNKVWIRDTIYTLLGFEAAKDIKTVIEGIHGLFDIFKKHEYKIDYAIKQKPQHAYQYIHARYDPTTLEEFDESWGNKQNDAIGAFLWKVGDLESKGVNVIRDEHDHRILHKLVSYLASIEYWNDADNGMWEESEEVHATSIGACVAGLEKISSVVDVPKWLINAGKETLWQLLPSESVSKKVDLALLSLIYPYNVVDPRMAQIIVNNVEKYLVRKQGVIRYVGDQYFYEDEEAQWPMGFAWLAMIYKLCGNVEKYKYYLTKTGSMMNQLGELPELYMVRSGMHNENVPLAWAQSLHMVAQV